MSRISYNVSANNSNVNFNCRRDACGQNSRSHIEPRIVRQPRRSQAIHAICAVECDVIDTGDSAGCDVVLRAADSSGCDVTDTVDAASYDVVRAGESSRRDAIMALDAA